MPTPIGVHKMTGQLEVCDGCIDAMVEYAGEMGLELSWRESTAYARAWGADIADHICDYRDAGKPCGCGCRAHDIKAERKRGGVGK